ncbi:MAG: hypothetical protein WKH64_14620 [Chloroflexia bacterium]
MTTTTATRRSFLTKPAQLISASAATANQAALQRDVLVCIFQRGGADGLSMVVPHGDKDYYLARPSLAVLKPGGAVGGSAIDLNGFFGLHPALAGLKPVWDAGQLAVVHACGSPDPTHSHFDAMDYMERGIPGQKSATNGWLGRHLAMTQTADDSTLRAVSFGALLQPSLRGSSAVTLTSIEDYRLRTWNIELPKVRKAHGELYKGSNLLAAGRRTLGSLTLMEQVVRSTGNPYKPSGGAVYPDTDYGKALKQIAQLVKADVGVQVACADIETGTRTTTRVARRDSSPTTCESSPGCRALTDLSVSRQGHYRDDERVWAPGRRTAAAPTTATATQCSLWAATSSARRCTAAGPASPSSSATAPATSR